MIKFPWSDNIAYRAGFVKTDVIGQYQPDAYIRDTIASSLPGHLPPSLFLLTNTWFMQTLLDRGDRMSTHSGLEIRMPFCDRATAEYMYNVPWAMKRYRNREKGLLRTALTGLLPDDVLWRKKSPYPKTHHPAYLSIVSTMLRDIISDPNAPLLGIADKDALERMLTDIDNPTPWYGQLMTLPQTIAYFVQINYWMKKYSVTLI